MPGSVREVGRPVVVSADDSSAALEAVRWAAAEAMLHDVALRVIHPYVWPMVKLPPVFRGMGPEGGLRAHAQQVLAEAVKTARSVAPDLDIQAEILPGLPVALLRTESRHALYVVVGASQQTLMADVVAGSPTVELLGQSHAPVAVVRDTLSPDRDAGLVVVGVDGSAVSGAAVKVALWEAAVRGARLLAVTVTSADRGRQARKLLGQQRDTIADFGVIRDALTEWRRAYPDVAIEERVVAGHPAKVLIDLSHEAALLVVGSRGRGGFTGLLLGSVSQTLLYNAHCPVIVVPPRSVTGPWGAVTGPARETPTSESDPPLSDDHR